MNKRGQIFLIGAIVFVITIYSLVIPYNTVKTYPTPEGYTQLNENYQTEFPKVMNFAIYNGTNITSATDNFTIGFLNEAKKKDPNFGSFYIYKDTNGNLFISNTLNDKVLKLEFTDVKGKTVEIGLLSADTISYGNICITGVACMGAKTKVSNFGNNYYQTQLKDPRYLRIVIDGIGTPIDISEFTSMAYTSSSQPIPLKDKNGNPLPDNIQVSLTQY